MEVTYFHQVEGESLVLISGIDHVIQIRFVRKTLTRL